MTTPSRRGRDLLLGPLLFALLVACLPPTTFPLNARIGCGLVGWLGWWWVTMPVAPGVTALVPLAVNAVFSLMPMEQLSKLYFSDIVVLLLGANLISIAWETTGLDKRLAMKALCAVGTSVARHVVVWFCVAAALSAVLPNAVVCALLVPIAVSMLRCLGDEAASPTVAMPVLLTAIVWGCGLGGMATPLGGAMNLVAVDYLERFSGCEFLYTDWVHAIVPYMTTLMLACLGYLMLMRPRGVSLQGGREYFVRRYEDLPRFSRDEAICLLLFILPTILAFARGWYAERMPDMKPAHLFLIAGLLAFVIPRRDGSPLATWKDSAPKIEWGLFLLFAGGLALGRILISTEAISVCTGLMSALQTGDRIALLLAVVACTVVFVEIASNTAAAAVAVPMVIELTTGLGLDPVPYVFVTAAAFNTGYMLPTSIRAIPVAYGLDTRYLFRHGAVMGTISIAVIVALGFMLV